jgi:hypothetical protein
MEKTHLRHKAEEVERAGFADAADERRANAASGQVV